MPAAHRHTDVCTGHGCWPSRANAVASGDVYVNNLGSHRVTDGWKSHCCPPAPCHGATQSTGSPDVFANNLAHARIGDSVSCGSSNSSGSPNVYINGG